VLVLVVVLVVDWAGDGFAGSTRSARRHPFFGCCLGSAGTGRRTREDDTALRTLRMGASGRGATPARTRTTTRTRTS